MASLTFSQAKTLLAPFITSQGDTDPVVASAINFVNERFITSGQWKGNRFIHSFDVSQDAGGNYYFDTVEGIESVLKAMALNPEQQGGDICDIMSDWYPWNDGGLGFMSPTYVGNTQVIRQGPVPSTSSYALLSGAGQEVDGLHAPSYAYDDVCQSSWVNTNGGPSFEVAEGMWQINLSCETQINAISGSSELEPWNSVWPSGISVTQVPMTSDNQRYRIVGQVPETRTIYCIVRRGYVPFVQPNDLLIPSNRNAYRYGVQAYNYENVNELERANVYWELAYKCLNEETISFEDGEFAEVDIQTKAFAPSLIQNLV